ncbi:hypothetical protein EMIT0P265_10503 [Pseudomonas zeae]|jgi:hypothetical protein
MDTKAGPRFALTIKDAHIVMLIKSRYVLLMLATYRRPVPVRSRFFTQNLHAFDLSHRILRGGIFAG